MKYIKICNKFFNLENFTKIIVQKTYDGCSVTITYSDESSVCEEFEDSEGSECYIQSCVESGLKNIE